MVPANRHDSKGIFDVKFTNVANKHRSEKAATTYCAQCHRNKHKSEKLSAITTIMSSLPNYTESQQLCEK